MHRAPLLAGCGPLAAASGPSPGLRVRAHSSCASQPHMTPLGLVPRPCALTERHPPPSLPGLARRVRGQLLRPAIPPFRRFVHRPLPLLLPRSLSEPRATCWVEVGSGAGCRAAGLLRGGGPAGDGRGIGTGQARVLRRHGARQVERSKAQMHSFFVLVLVQLGGRPELSCMSAQLGAELVERHHCLVRAHGGV